jgi:FAD/FMN-containing dehydrogenase
MEEIIANDDKVAQQQKVLDDEMKQLKEKRKGLALALKRVDNEKPSPISSDETVPKPKVPSTMPTIEVMSDEGQDTRLAIPETRLAVPETRMAPRK